VQAPDAIAELLFLKRAVGPISRRIRSFQSPGVLANSIVWRETPNCLNRYVSRSMKVVHVTVVESIADLIGY
jgi:hypothetical protein